MENNTKFLENFTIDNYTLAEFVCVPPNFDVEFYMSMHERIGIFETDKIKKHDVKIIVDAIKSNVLFTTMNNPNIHPNSCFFILSLFQDLDLIIKSIDNPLRRSMDKHVYQNFSKRWETDRYNVRGDNVSRISFLVFNIYYIFSDNVYDEVITRAKKVEEMQKSIDKIDFTLN
jgi:hypothetical protein